MYNTITPALNGGIAGDSGKGVPLKNGYRFAGYEKNASGEMTASWKKWTVENLDSIESKHFGADDGLKPKAGGNPVSVTEECGERGEAVYTVKTVYTEINIDGEKDPAYDYGLHLKGAIGSNAEYYKDRSTCIDIYMVRGQDGRAYVYGEVTDPDIVVNDEIIAFKPHYCDGLHPYVDFGNYGFYPSILGLITPDVSGKHLHRAPRGCCVIVTDTGFKFEYAFDNKGKPFLHADEIAFNFYYNDTNELVDAKNYKRYLVKLPSKLNSEGSKFILPDSKHFDSVRFSEESATGAFVEERVIATEKTGDMIADILSGAASVNIVYPKLASAHSVLGAKALCRRLRIYGANANAYCEDGANADDADYLILVDNTSAPESRELIEKIKYNGYGLKIGDGRIAIAGWREEAMNSAFVMLVSAVEYVMAGGKTADLDSLYTDSFEYVPNVPEMDGLTTVTDAGDGAYLLLKQNATEEDYKAYYNKLLCAGYTLYTENTMVSVRAATFYNDNTVVNLTYGENESDRSLRAVVDVKELTSLPMLGKEEYTPVCESKIYQLAPSKVGLMCYVIKQDNGEYFIIDAGGNGAHKFIFDSLMEISGGEDVVVSGWLFTHFHCDHIGGFIEFADREEYMKKVTVKSIILNFPQWQVLDTSSPFDHRNLERWQGVVEKTGATVYQARTAQKYYFGNVELEMLFTYEDLMPFNIFMDRTNPTSHIFSMTVNGQKFIMTGDACGEATKLVAERYSDYIKADFVQLPHHGWGDGGTALEFYEKVDAPFVLYPGSGYFPSPSEKWACEHSKEYFLNSDKTTELALPYTG